MGEPLGTIRERDVDFLLQEELLCSEGFRRGILGLAHRSGLLMGWDESSVPAATLSLVHDNGETDIFLRLLGPSGCAALLIENKIDAQFQKEQAARYRQRATRQVRLGEAVEAITVLVAPERYLGREACKSFDLAIRYEDLAEILEVERREAAGTPLDARLRYRIAVLQAAIEASRSSRVPSNEERNLSFRRAYYGMVREVAPSLRMPDPLNRADGGRQHFAKALALIPGCRARLTHQFRQGAVALQINGWGHWESEATPRLQGLLEEGMRVTLATNSLAVVLDVPAIDHEIAYEPQDQDAKAGIRAALRLQGWWRRHADDIRRLAQELAEAEFRSKTHLDIKE